MCSGRVEPYFILEALQAGADGVLVLGCHPGECHYLEGNYRTVARMALLKKMLTQFGIEDDRVRLDWVSASEGVRFAAIINQVTEAVRALGPFQRDEAGDVSPNISGHGPREGVAPRGFAAGGGDVSPNKVVAHG